MGQKDIAAKGHGRYYLIADLILLYPSFAVNAKRWHDRDKSAWWVLLGLIPVLGQILCFIVLGFIKGTEGSNRFGPDPLESKHGNA